MKTARRPLVIALVPAALLCVLLLAGWYFLQPLPFPSLDRCARIEATYTQLSPGLIGSDSATLLPASSQWEEVGDLLRGSSYRRCWDTLLGSTSTGSLGPCIVILYGYSQSGELLLDLTITSGRQILVNGRVYRMDREGAGSAGALAQSLARTMGFS